MLIPQSMLDERNRQISEEGWSADHDDHHANGELLQAASMYYRRAIGQTLPMRTTAGEPGGSRNVPIGWPWEPSWWKPKSSSRDLERAGALCLAEIERLVRRGSSSRHVEETLDLIVSAYVAQVGQ